MMQHGRCTPMIKSTLLPSLRPLSNASHDWKFGHLNGRIDFNFFYINLSHQFILPFILLDI